MPTRCSSGLHRTRGPDRRAATGSGGPRTPRSMRRPPTGVAPTARAPPAPPTPSGGTTRSARRAAWPALPGRCRAPGRRAATSRRRRRGPRGRGARRRRATARWAAGRREPGERAVHRLVVRQRRRADSAGVEQAVGPVRRRRARHRHEPDRDGGGEGQRPPVPQPRDVRSAPAARRTRAGSASDPAAMPISTPDQRRSGRSRSTSTASISSRLTCPKVRFCHTGSSASAPTVSSATSHPGWADRATPTTTMTAASAATDAPVQSAAASHGGSSASGIITTAANGG